MSIERLADNLSKNAKNSVICTRSFFKWITYNIRYDSDSDCKDVSSVLSNKRCSSEGYAHLFEQMCRLKNITVITIRSSVKNYSFTVDYQHIDDGDLHVWNAVLIDNTYHYIDCTWAALPVSGQKPSTCDIEDTEHFFFTSPEVVGDLC